MTVGWTDRIVYWLARLAIGVAARVPEGLGYGLAAWLGRLYFRCDKRRRGYALHFLRNAIPELDDRARHRLGARATGNLFKVPLDMARLTRLLARGGDIGSVVDYTEAVSMQRMPAPFLGLTAHLGSWEVAAIAVAQRRPHAHGVARVSKNPLLQRWILDNRQRGGLHIHPRRGGIKELARALEQGGIGLQVVDQNQRLRGVFAPFFGEIASCERAAASLALRRGYPILVGVALRVGTGFRFRFVVSDPIVLQRTGDKAKDLVAAVTRINATIESMIRLAPDQYLWIHDRYRTKPSAAEPAEDAAGDED